ncbi:MAG: ComEC/Rec2 family competence protein, partial [Bacilli bacterium]|nr:ComEC/Rec2 family competence protein [Bacilli bacterium]
MKLFLILLIIISSYTLISPSTFFISLVLLGLASFLTFKHYKTDKIFILILSIIFVLFLIIRNVNLETFQSENSFVGIVIKRKDSYLIVFDGIERFYVKTDDPNIDVLDIIKIDGNFSKYNGQPVLESGFDFKNYLSERGINRQIYINNIEKIFNFPFDSNSYKNSVLNQFESIHTKVLAKSLLFGEIDYNDNLIKELKISGSFLLFSLSGIHINGLYKLFESILSRFVEENKEKKITYIIFLPWFLINIFNIAFIRIFLNKTLRLILEKKNVEINELEFKSSIYLIILVFNKFALAEVSIQISATISFFLYLCNVYIYRKIKFIRKFISSLIVFMVLIPFNLALNNSFNVLNILINLLVLPLVKFIILLIFPSIFMFKLSFMEGILNLVYDSFSFINFHNLNINGDAFNQ